MLTDDPVTLVGSPEGGTFYGVGVTDGVFDPAAAGEGVYRLYYTIPESGTGNKYLIQSQLGDPWPFPANHELMNLAFGGASEWIYEEFETMDFDAIFADSTGFIYLDGSSLSSVALSTFLSTYILDIQEWVNNGGHLFLNSAPNVGADIDFGFGGTTLNFSLDYSTARMDVKISNLTHPSVYGPFLPIAPMMSGTYYSHGIIEGSGYQALLVDTTIDAKVLVAEKNGVKAESWLEV